MSEENKSFAMIPGNPSEIFGELKLTLTNDARGTWEEVVDISEVFANTLIAKGRQIERDGPWIQDTQTHMRFLPGMADMSPLDDGAAQSCTTIEIHHEAFGPGVFEFQHANGDNFEASIRSGFEQWADLDLPVLQEALLLEMDQCSRMEMEFPEKDGRPAHRRRVLFGPCMHYAESMPPEESFGEDCHPPFCPCCLFTNTIEAFLPLVESTDFAAIRFYAARDETGAGQSDCRVNGEDHEAGWRALLAYVDQWADLGFEFRKQYVVIQTISSEAEA